MEERSEGTATQFALKDPPLIEALKAAGQGVEATVTVVVKGDICRAKRCAKNRSWVIRYTAVMAECRRQ